MQNCLKAYGEILIDDDELAKPKQAATDTRQSMPFKNLFHLTLPEEFVIESRLPHLELDDGDTMLNTAELSSSPYFKFHETFRQLLNEKYGHLPENSLFGKPDQEEESRVVLLDHFEEVKECKCFEDFEKLFSRHFQSTESTESLGVLQWCFKELMNEMTGHSDSKAAQLSRLIVDQVTMFCFYLIDSRIKSMQIFEELEEDLHGTFTSYDFVQSLKKEDDFLAKQKTERGVNDFLQRIQSLEKEYIECNRNTDVYDNHKRSVYGRQMKLYEEALLFLKEHQWIGEECSVLQCLKDTRKNHFSYLHEHIHRLGKLLSPLKEQYQVSISEDERCIFSVTMVAGTISGALSALRSELSKGPKPDEIRLRADTALYGDQDITDFEGVNIVCIAPVFDKVKNNKLGIKTDGKQLSSIHQQVKKADNGNEGTDGDIAGKDGTDGRDGDYGNAGGHILVVANSLQPDHFDLSAKGSRGQDGQDGGDGGAGFAPTRCGRKGSEPDFTSGWLKTHDAVIINYGTFGEDGGPGGNAGMGGAPGESGINGKLELLDLNDAGNSLRPQETVGDASAGLPGNSGKGGKSTTHGWDWGAYAKKPGFWGKFRNFFTTNENRDISMIKGDLEHSSIRYNPGSGNNYERKATGLPWQHKDTSHKWYHNRGRKGEGNSAKVRVNSALAKENKAIDKQSCYQAMRQQCKQSLQHWNVSSHNQFLNAFAQKLGNIHDSSLFVALTHSEVMKANSALWIERIQKQSEAMQSIKVHQKQRTTKVQTFLMKDFEEATKHCTLGYLGSARDDQKPLSLNLSSLQATTKQCGIDLNNISMDTLLLSGDHDKTVEKLSQLGQSKQVFIMVCSTGNHRPLISHDFLIVRDSGQKCYRYYHQRTGDFLINDPTICKVLDGVSLQENQFVVIGRDDFFYPKMIALIYGQFGDISSVPLTSGQFHCLQQLQLIVAIRKTYQIFGGKYTKLSQRQSLCKLYGQYLDEVLTSQSIESLTSLQQDMVMDDLLILPLETSWITTEADGASVALHKSVDVFNQEPTLSGLLGVMVEFHNYHRETIAQPKKRQVYLWHLSSSVGLEAFFDQLCVAVQVFCNKGQIDEALGGVPTITSSEAVLHQIALPTEGSTLQASMEDCKKAISFICEQQLLVYTVVDRYIDGLAKCMGQVLGIDLPKRKIPPHPPSDLTFEESYAAFETLPCIPTIMAALSVYTNHHAASPPTQYTDKLQHLLASVYHMIRDFMSTVTSQIDTDTLVQKLKTMGMHPELLYENVKTISKHLNESDPTITALVHLLKQFHNLTTLSSKLLNYGESNESQQGLEPTALLVCIPNVLENGRDFCKQRLKASDKDASGEEAAEVIEELSFHRQCIVDIHNALHCYPLASPVSALSAWMQRMNEINELVPCKTKSKFRSSGSIVENVQHLKSTLESCLSALTDFTSLNVNLQWMEHAEDLAKYAELHHTQDKAKLLVQWELGLVEQFHSTSCMDTLSCWLYPGLTWLSPLHVTVVTERFSPKHDVFIQNQKPQEEREVSKPTVYLYPGEQADHWQLVYQEPGKSFDFLDADDLNDKLLNDMLMLTQDVRQYLKNHNNLTVSEEQKASLLGKLLYEKELTIRHSARLNDQVLVNEVNIQFSLVVIKMHTSEVKFCRNTDMASIDFKIEENDLLIIQGQCRAETQRAIEHLKRSKVLDISDQELSLLQGAAAMCLIRHPGQPVTLQVISECGDIAMYDFKCRMPIITDLSDGENQTFTEQLKPLSDLLISFLDYRESMGTLNSAVQNALKKYTTSLHCRDIPELVRAVRFHFIQECFAANLLSNGPPNFKTVQLSLKPLINGCNSTLLEDMYLIGFESFLTFFLAQTKKSKSTVASMIGSMDTTNANAKFWQQVLDKKTITSEDVKCLCMAFAFLECPNNIDQSLYHESVFFRLQTYHNIEKGLRNLELTQEDDHGTRNRKSDLKVTRLLKHISHYQSSYQVDALQEASLTLDNERNLRALLELIQSAPSLEKQLLKQLADERLQNVEACHAVLKNSHFYNRVYEMVLSWCMDQQNELVTKIQSLVSDTMFAHDERKGEVVNAMSCWLIDKTQAALSAHFWTDLLCLYQIGSVICKSLEFGILSVRNEGSSSLEHSDLLHNCLTLTQVIDASSDIISVLTVLQDMPSDEWFTHLFVQNFLTVCVDHFEIKSVEDKAYIQEKLLCTDRKLLQILYNVFIDEQYSHKNADSEIGIISEAQLKMILDWLPFIEPNPDACSALCKTTMSMWEKELAEIHFKQYLDHWHGLAEANKKRITYLMNRVRLSEGKTNFLSFLSVIKGKYISSKVQDSSPLISLVEDLYYNRISLQQANDVIQRYPYKQWSQQFIILKSQKHHQSQPRNIEQVLELIEEQVQSHSFKMSGDTFASIKEEAQKIAHQIKNSRSLSKDSIKKQLKTFSKTMQRFGTIDEKLQWLVGHHVDFVVHLIKAWMLVNQVETTYGIQMQTPYSTQLVSLLLFLHTNEDGLLQQVKTGEGKTLIVAMLAAAKALLGFHVDVVSSNRDLAQDGERKCRDYFNALGLESAINCDDDDDTNQQSYRSHIVYGDVGSFQRDVLTEETESGGTNFSRRYSNLRNNCLIVDEVDSMFLDKGRHMLYISHESPALKHLESLLIMIWSSVLSINCEGQEEQALVDALLDQLATDLNMLIEKKQITVPAYLTDFCCRKMKAWVRSAYQARLMDADDQFVIDHRNKEDAAAQTKQIFPVDKQTGIEEYNMKWSNGLSQFLELKYRRALSTESLKAIFISNKRFFKRYGTALFGLTGTLGSSSSRKLLQEVYSISTVELPTNKPKRYTQAISRVSTKDEEWREAIYVEICERSSDQPTLVICENIKRLNYLRSHLEVKQNGQYEIIDYARDGDDVEQLFDEGGALPNQIVLATNKGGRGTDIKIKEDKVPKGLHVIVSFLPENTRIEEQAFGRAARAGQAGSGCLVLQVDPDDYQSEIELFGAATAAAEIIIEMEKIKRDQGERERISQLLSEGIPQLDLEEGLYELFQKHKKAFEDSLKDARLFGDILCGAPRRACVDVLIDHWAYWLDSVHHKIQAADSDEKRQALMEEFDKDFPSQPLSSASFSEDNEFFIMPEHCIQLGQAYLQDKNFKLALQWFEKAIDRGDLTGVSAMAGCYCYIKSNSNLTSNKRTARHFLKKAKVSLDVLRRSWMANGEIAKSLVDLINVSQYVDAEENHYAEQVEDKLKVIGLHLNTLDTLIGSSLDESSFVNASKLQVEKITEAESEKIYHKLVKNNILCHHRVRKCWKRQEALVFIKEEVDETIADKLITRIVHKAESRGNINEEDLNDLVYSSDELWHVLCPLFKGANEPVVLLELGQIDAKLTEEVLKKSWETLKQLFSRGSNGTQVLPTTHPVYQKLKKEKEYEALINHLKSNSLYRETNRAELKPDSSEQMKVEYKLGKYEMCKVKDEEGKERSLREFMVGLFDYCHDHEASFFYKHMLPFDCKRVESKKLHAFLREQDILKSGLLALHKYDNDDQNLRSSVKKALDEVYTTEQMTFILNALQGLRGEIRGFERDMEVGFVDFYKLKDRPDDIPVTLDFFTTWHLDQFLTLEQEEKGWWDWNAFAVAMLGLAQVIAGAALIAFSVGAASQFGSGLIAEGINDMVYATMAGLTGTFSWKDWAIQKAISVAISIATGGLGLLATPAKVAVKIGSAARYSTFAKTILKAAGDFALNVTNSIISDVVLVEVQESVVSTIVDGIEKELFTKIEGPLRSLLTTIAAHETSNDTFHSHCQGMKKNIEIALGKDSMLPEAFDQLRSKVASSLQQTYKSIADSLSKSNSKWAKLLCTGSKAAVMANKVCDAVQMGLNTAQAVDALFNVLPKEEHTTTATTHSHVDEEIIKRELDDIKACFKAYIHDQIRGKLKGVLENIIKGSLSKVARAGKRAVSSKVKETFRGKNPSQVVKDLQAKKKKQTLVSDYGGQSQHKQPTSSSKPSKPTTHAEKKQRAYQQRREGFQHTVLKPQAKHPSKEHASKLSDTLKAADGKLHVKYSMLWYVPNRVHIQ